MNDDIWVVSYSVGAYSSREDWAVAWYPTEAQAEAHRAAFDQVLLAARAAEAEWRRAMRTIPWRTREARIELLSASAPHLALSFWLRKGVELLDADDINFASVSRVPRGTLPLHGLEAR